MPSYAEKLKDPRWQRKRLEVLEAAGWACSRCCRADRTLHVHHGYYQRGLEPWEYDDEHLSVLCEPCHEQEQVWLADVHREIGAQPSPLTTILGFARGLRAIGEGIIELDLHAEDCGYFAGRGVESPFDEGFFIGLAAALRWLDVASLEAAFRGQTTTYVVTLEKPDSHGWFFGLLPVREEAAG